MSVAWWRKEIRLRRVPFYKVGKRILISRRDIHALLKAARVEPVEGRRQALLRRPNSESGPRQSGEGLSGSSQSVW